MFEGGRGCLLVSVSARALAASAARGGTRPLVIDLFTDLDTREAARATRCARTGDGLVFDVESLLAAADELDPERRATVVYGSGFDAAPVNLARLGEHRRVLGNDARAVRELKDPSALAALLARLGVPHPEISREPPDDARGWLCKRAGAAGGAHVRAASAADSAGERDYFQRRVDGLAASAVLLSDGVDAVVLGHTELLFEPLGPDRPYLYGGGMALSADRLHAGVREGVAAAARALTRAHGLRGLWGVDFLVDGERWWLLEVNPRPGASFELHEHGRSLFALHVAACAGVMPELPAPRDTLLHAQRIVYAAAPLTAPALASWPAWVSDRPLPGTAIATGEPVCSVHAAEATAMALRVALGRRTAQLQRRISGWREAAA